jgi:type IV pilus assembly protein PilE
MLEPKSKAPQRGFTLIELMVTVAIVAILATIAAESYQAQAVKSRRTDARSALMDIAGREEKVFSVNNAYSSTASDVGYSAFPVQVGGPADYSVTIAVPDPNQAPTTATTYLITATAIGPQAGDGACTTFTLNQLGQQSFTGTGPAATCWGN